MSDVSMGIRADNSRV